MTAETSTADDFFAPLNDALLRTLDEDEAMTVAVDIPDGWAKLDGRWVRLAQVGTVHHDRDGWPLFSGTTPSDSRGNYVPHCPVYRIVEAL